MEIQGKYNKAKIFTDNVDSMTIGQIINLCNQKEFEGSNIRIMPDCLTEDTEVLTRKGFKLITELEYTDLVANYKDSKIYFSKPKNIISRDLRLNEKVYEYYNKNLAFKLQVSENHRMALKDNMDNIAKNVDHLKLQNMNLSGSYFGSYSEFNKYEVNFLLLLLWTVGDGSYAFSNKNSIRVRFDLRKERKIIRIIELLKSLEIDYKIYNDNAIYVNTKDSKKIYEILGDNKNYPIDLIFVNKEKRMKMIDELIKIDGDYTNFINKNTYRLNSKRKEDIDFFQMLMCLTERYTTFKNKISNGFGKETLMYYTSSLYESNVKTNKSGLGKKVIKRQEIDYKGKLVCIECESSYFIARQNGIVFVTGNCHAGKGCTIGTTMTITNKIVPNLVGVDIGCGMATINLGKYVENIDYNKLDGVIRNYIPHGFKVHNRSREKLLKKSFNIDLNNLRCEVNTNRAYMSLGTLGGGNHFIEVDKNENGNLYLTVHTGSRNLGKQIAEYYQNKAIKYCVEKYDKAYDQAKEFLISTLKKDKKEYLINDYLKHLNDSKVNKPHDDLCYLENNLMKDYLHDMNIAQKYAAANRVTIIADILFKYNDLNVDYGNFIKDVKCNIIECIHNYIDIENKILRKGAISANKNETVIIPINMRDGIILGRGKENKDWNYSAPHGAGRILSRGQAKERISLNEFKESMKDVFTTCVGQSTLDEAPQAYKPIDDILNNIIDTVEIVDILKPFYNFKSN